MFGGDGIALKASETLNAVISETHSTDRSVYGVRWCPPCLHRYNVRLASSILGEGYEPRPLQIVEMCICKVCFGAPYATMAIAMRYKDEVDVVPFWLQLILGL